MSARNTKPPKRATVRTFQRKHERREAISMVTAYDYPSARAADQAGVDGILVGDSLAMVVLGYDSTLPVTMDEMLHHARAVRRGAQQALLVGDLPFMSYQVDVGQALRNAGRYLKEAGMDAVKMEGGRALAPTIEALVRSGIPVQGHIGLTPQHVRRLGGYRVQGRTAEAARDLLDDARALEDAGCFSVVLESVPARLAADITSRLSVPTIGIGAGPETSGQILVFHDLLGIEDRLHPRFVKRYAALGDSIEDALQRYRADVEAGRFPAAEHTYTMPDEAWQDYRARVDAASAVADGAPLGVRRIS